MIELLRAAHLQDMPSCSETVSGGSRAQVLVWSARRVIDLLRYRGRRPLALNQPGAADLTPQEQILSSIFAALDAGNHDDALTRAQWLVPTSEARRLVRWAQPVVQCATRLHRAA
jgi:hypothetical protein